MNARRPHALEAGLFLLVVALPLAFFPQSRGAFLDVKLLLLAGGTLLLWISGLPVDRRVAYPALAWGSAVVLAALFGVDPLESLVGTVRGTGVIMLLCAAALAPLAPSIPNELLERARGWLVWTGVVERHPLNPGVRRLAADVELLLGNFPATRDSIREQLEVFPHDSITVPTDEPGLTLPT